MARGAWEGFGMEPITMTLAKGACVSDSVGGAARVGVEASSGGKGDAGLGGEAG